MKRVLLTGGAGFIGSQVARCLIAAGWQVRVLDLLTYAGKRAHLDGLPCELVVGDVCDPAGVRAAVSDVDAVVHMAAESHVARALDDADPFLRTNVGGTRVMLAESARAGVGRFLHISTDEVFGQSLGGRMFSEGAPLRPGNAYAASKAGAEALVHAWRHTYNYPAGIVRCTNNYGPRQHPEKAVPCWILAAIAGGPLPVHGRGLAVRDWLHVADFARGIVAALERWQPAATWHFAGRQPLENRDMAGRIARSFGGLSLNFGPDRAGQDAAYAIDDTRTRRELGWAPEVSLAQGLAETIAWYEKHGHLWS